MSNDRETIKLFENINVLQNGHFILSSGLHSEHYLQCAKIFEHPKIAEGICKQLANKIKKKININDIDKIVSPAVGGIIVGYEVAKQLGLDNIFLERIKGEFSLRRGFEINKNQNILIIEDVVSTGKSSRETFKVVVENGAKIVAEACIVNRSGKKNPFTNIEFISLIDLDLPTYEPHLMPNHLNEIEAIKPGSRFIKNK
jgi:orotate phosphoribosyltransferase